MKSLDFGYNGVAYNEKLVWKEVERLKISENEPALRGTTPSIHDVARYARVSTATVSRSFRTPELLAEETLSRVIEAARHLNYRPRQSHSKESEPPEGSSVTSSSGIKKGLQGAIGFQFFSDRKVDTPLSDAFYTPMLMGAQKEAASHGFDLLIHTTDFQNLMLKIPKMVSQKAVDGILLVGAANNPNALGIFAEHVPHINLLDGRDAAHRFECVVSDGFGGMYQATRFLLESGHCNIAFYMSEVEDCTAQDRLHGYVSALLDAGIVPVPEKIIGGQGDTSFELRETRLTNLLAHKTHPTALVAATDDDAFHVVRTLRRLGLRAPDDISIIGFGDAPYSLHSDPPLATVKVDKEGMGRLAVQRLIARISAPEGTIQYPVVNQVAVSLAIRQSCRSL